MDLSATIHLLGEQLGKVITEQESVELFNIEERIRMLAKARRAGEANAADGLAEQVGALPPDVARGVAAAFTVYFDLINLAEEAYRVEALRQREHTASPLSESVEAAILELKQGGHAPAAVQTLLDELAIELVLTAHPTEAKRRTVLSKLQRVSELIAELGRDDLLPREQAAVMQSLQAEITSLWLTDRARTSKPAVTDEVRTGLFFVDSVFWETLPRIYGELVRALAAHYPSVRAPRRWLTLASWVGGDRDGNPNVTHEVTAETLRLHRGLAVERHRRALGDLARRLSMSARRLPPPDDLLQWLKARRPLPAHVAFLETRYANEPYRLAVSLLAADLESASKDDMTARLLDRAPHKARAVLPHFTRPLDTIASAMRRAPAVASDQLAVIRRQLDVFGLHAARLDIREDSTRLAAALGELLRGLDLDLQFAQRPDSERAAVIIELLSQPKPALAERPGLTPETAETFALLQLMARANDIYGNDLLGPFIISMTRGAADVLTVLLLAQWAGCADGLQIVPLFETLDDLDASPRILSDLFVMPQYRQHLQTCRNGQMVMIGYSDSNKDGGYLGANWALYRAQQNIANICRKHEVRLTLFHGRGGTVARGGGPANRAIRAQPPGTVNSRFRLTEQGETIAAHYANPHIAHRHLEQLVHAVLLASAQPPVASELNDQWRAAMDTMARAARSEYRALVFETPGFIEFWRTATPLEEISRLHIGSRPTSRRGGVLRPTDIRAIPWVFSWMQSRFNLPGWYGLGAALGALDDKKMCRDMYEGWPFFRALLDNAEMSLLKADMGIAALYVALVLDAELGQTIFGRIRVEYDRTRAAILDITRHNELMDGEPVIQRSVQLRNPYVDPLNYLQVEMLKRLRALPATEAESPQAEALREVIVLTINGIAAGLRNTG